MLYIYITVIVEYFYWCTRQYDFQYFFSLDLKNIWNELGGNVILAVQLGWYGMLFKSLIAHAKPLRRHQAGNA